MLICIDWILMIRHCLTQNNLIIYLISNILKATPLIVDGRNIELMEEEWSIILTDTCKCWIYFKFDW